MKLSELMEIVKACPVSHECHCNDLIEAFIRELQEEIEEDADKD